MKETLRQQIERLKRDCQEWEDRYYEVKERNEQYEIEKSSKRAILEAVEEKRKDYLSEENRKLWYLIRTLIKDENLKPIELIDNMGNKRHIDVFEQQRYFNSF